MKLNSITPDLMVENVKNSMEYYQTNFGFETVMTVPESGDDLVFGMIKRDDVTLMFESRQSPTGAELGYQNNQTGGTFLLYLKMEGVEELYNEVKERVKIKKELHKTFYGATEFLIEDLDGYIITFAD